jgi:hypothetical protein
MQKPIPMTKASLERALAEIHTDRETALELLRLGIYRVRRDGRLHNGKCEAHARTTGKPCRAPAMENGRCKLHGGLSTGPRTKKGLERTGAASRERMKRWWARWRAENGRTADSR